MTSVPETSTAYASGNRLIDLLVANGLTEIKDTIAVFTLKAHQSTHSVGKTMHHVDFPINAVLSIVATLKNGDTVEVGTTGNESFVQSEAALDSPKAPRTSFCQVQGLVGRMDIDCFNKYMNTSEVFARFVRKNLSAVLFSSQQFTVCNVKHTVLQRCARWFAMTADRVGRPEFNLAHEFLAIMLGVRPASVSEAVDKLHALGATNYVRGAVTIEDESLLKSIACECYEASKAAFDQSLTT